MRFTVFPIVIVVMIVCIMIFRTIHITMEITISSCGMNEAHNYSVSFFQWVLNIFAKKNKTQER